MSQLFDDRLPVVLVLLDGLGDRAAPELSNRTPAEAARTPVLDELARRGSSGVHVPFGPGRATSSEAAHWALFGYADVPFTGRAAHEALGAGLEVSVDTPLLHLALRGGETEAGCIRLGARARRGRDEADVDALFDVLHAVGADGFEPRLQPIRTGECLLTLSGAASHEISDTDALFDHLHPWLKAAALDGAAEPVAAAHTATALNDWLIRGHRVLLDDPVNRGRRERGLDALCVPVTKWASRIDPRLPPFEAQAGLRGGIVTDTALYRGFARLLDMTMIDLPYDSGDPTGDMRRRLDLAVEALDHGDFVHVHVKATDEAGHNKSPATKRDVIEATAQGLERLTDLAARAIVAVTGDHATPSVGGLLHSGDPTPIVVAGPGIRPDGIEQFGERNALRGELGRLGAADILPLLLGFANRPFFRGHRPGARTSHGLPDRPPAMPVSSEGGS